MTGRARVAVALAVAITWTMSGCGGDDGAAPATSSTALPPPDTGVRLPDATPGSGAGGAPADDDSAPVVDLAVDDLPDGWPRDFPIPEKAVVDLGSSTTIDRGRVLGVQLCVAGTTPMAVVQGYLDALDADGYTVLRDQVTGSGSSAQGTVTFETTAYVGDILVVTDGPTAVGLTLTATYPPG